jgi:hypothetical protein
MQTCDGSSARGNEPRQGETAKYGPTEKHGSQSLVLEELTKTARIEIRAVSVRVNEPARDAIGNVIPHEQKNGFDELCRDRQQEMSFYAVPWFLSL